MISKLFQLVLYGHVHEWQKINSWSYRDYRCKHCGKTTYARNIGKPVTEWNQK